jgi:DNA-binding transcriptional regulator YiaG
MKNRFCGGYLYIANDKNGYDEPISLNDPTFPQRLDTLLSLQIEHNFGKVSARKERRQRGGNYWTAYKKVQGKLKKTYIGTSKEFASNVLSSVRKLMELDESSSRKSYPTVGAVVEVTQQSEIIQLPEVTQQSEVTQRMPESYRPESYPTENERSYPTDFGNSYPTLNEVHADKSQAMMEFLSREAIAEIEIQRCETEIKIDQAETGEKIDESMSKRLSVRALQMTPEKIKGLRTSRGLSQYEFAKLLGV